jgi:hypothetical protein
VEQIGRDAVQIRACLGFIHVGAPVHQVAAVRFLEQVVGNILTPANMQQVGPKRRRSGVVEQPKSRLVESAGWRISKDEADDSGRAFHAAFYA